MPIDTFVVSAMLHPSHYQNKLLLGSVQGPLRLVNVTSRKLIYWFKGFDAPVTCLAQSPAVDVCAVGLSDGRIVLHNLLYDTTLISVRQDGGAITSIDFRSGNNQYFDLPNSCCTYKIVSFYRLDQSICNLQ